MRVSPIVTAALPPSRRPAAPGGTPDWAIDLPIGGQPVPLGPYAPPSRPVPPPAPARPVKRFSTADTNYAYLNGRNLRYSPDGHFGVLIPYLTADMIDKTPNDPLNLWAMGSYRLNVQAARIELTQADLNAALAGASTKVKGQKQQVSHLHGSLLDGNRVALGGIAWPGGLPLPIPFSIRIRADRLSTSRVRVTPESVRVFGLPVAWAIRLFHIDIAKHLPGGGTALVNAPGGAVDADLTQNDMFRGDLTGLEIRNGRAVVTIGGAPAADVDRARRMDDPNYCEVRTVGEVELDAGNIRNGKVVIIDSTPDTPYTINKWDVEGYARLENGQVVLPEAKLAAKFGNVGDGFKADSIRLQGTDLCVSGSKEVLGMPIPVNFKVAFQATAKGELRLWPHDVHVAGIGFGQGQIVDAMASMPGMRRDGDGVILNMRTSAQVDMPPIVAVRAEPGKIVLDTGAGR